MELRDDPLPSRMVKRERNPEELDGEDASILVRREVLNGSWPGGMWVRMVLPRRKAFQRLRTGVLQATPGVQRPQTLPEHLKRLLIGEPIATTQAEHERLTKWKALAVLSSDAISSVAYATEAILLSLAAAGSQSLGTTLFISFAIVGLLAIVALSYRQTIPAYPNGGGSYIVARENLGTFPGLVAAASLMIDYVLTVAVSVSAGVQALVTLFPELAPALVAVSLNVALVIVITLVNLRGVRESGAIFAFPTYLFIASTLLLIVLGCIKAFLLLHQPVVGHFSFVAATEPLSIFLILKSFAAGCSAMTGVEAISNGVPAFQKPETRNAATTLTWMAAILGALFLGITLLALSYHIEANLASNPTVVGQLARQVFTGPLFWLYPVFQFATLLILTLAANTSYSDFPRLASLLARDGFLPHQFAFRGDRLAFSSGIIFLAFLASLLLVVFQGKTSQLINLYAVGVFISFTLSQSGMVRHWWRLRTRQKGWQRSMVMNGLGALTTLTVSLVIATTKFLEGAWIVVLLIPLLVLLFLGIRRHYRYVKRRRILADIPFHCDTIHHRFVVPIAQLNRAARQALAYARSISPNVTALQVPLDGTGVDALCHSSQEWQEELSGVEQGPIEIIGLRYHMPLFPLLDTIRHLHCQYPEDTLTVVLPEAFETSWRRVFSSPKIMELKVFLFFKPQIVVTNVSLQRQDRHRTAPLHPGDIRHRCIVPIAELDKAAIQSLAYALSISPHVIAAHVAIDEQDIEEIRSRWEEVHEEFFPREGVQLVVIESPYRSLVRPLLAYIDTVQETHPEETLTVVLPEVVAHWWEQPLHKQTALCLKAALLNRPGIVVTDIPHHLYRKRSF